MSRQPQVQRSATTLSRAQDGSDFQGYVRSVSTGGQGRLILTMCTPTLERNGAYARRLVLFPQSYEDASRLARSVFMSYIANENSTALVLKCAIKKADGVVAWCDFSPDDWTDIVHPNEDEIGIFLQDFQDLPYEPQASAQISLSTPNTRSISATSQPIANVTPVPGTRVVTLHYGRETKATLAPQSLNALKIAAKSIFPSINRRPLSDICFKSADRVPGAWDAPFIYLEEETYLAWLVRQVDSINLTVEAPYEVQRLGL